jgi:hypothetical protein
MREKKVRAYNDAMNTLVQKEELLQYHNHDFVVDINVEHTVTLKENRPQYNLDMITFDEQLELMRLFKKARKDESELAGIIQAKNSEGGTVDVTYEEFSVVPNISLIKHEALPVENNIQGNKRVNPTTRLQEIHAKLVARRIKEAGGHLDADEENLIK